jgi:hypothetical protein
MRPLALGLAAMLLAPPALADWQYTRWGMTPEQVVAASRGKVALLPEARRPRVPPLVTAASGKFTDGTLVLRTVFSFAIAGNGLECVTYGVRSRDDDEAFKALLTRRFGPPQTTGGLAFLGMTQLGWVVGNDEINASFSPDDPGYAMQCRKG